MSDVLAFRREMETNEGRINLASQKFLNLLEKLEERIEDLERKWNKDGK